jgi:hypothetical protein
MEGGATGAEITNFSGITRAKTIHNHVFYL